MNNATPDPILQLLGAHLTAKYLFVATETGVFERLAAGPAALDELARRLDMPQRTTRILVDALVAAGWLTLQQGLYSNTPVTASFLSGRGPAPDLRPILQLWNQVVYPQWLTLEDSLRHDKATYGYADLSDIQRTIFSDGVGVLTAPSAHALASTYDFGRHRRLLDLGGGTGSFLTAILRRHPHLRATLFEMPATAAIARQRLAASPDIAADIVEGDLHSGPIPQGHDVCLLANVVHLFAPARNQALLSRIRSAAPSDSRLLLVDFWTDPTHTQPAFAALMAGEFQIVTGEGDVYSVEEVRAWLEASGWRLVEHKPLAGAASLVVAEASESGPR